MNHWPETQDLPILSSQEKQLDFSNVKPVTKIISKELMTKRSYVNVPNELRLQLVEAVYIDGETIKNAAKRLGVNYSSAKSICQIYKNEGRSDRKVSKWINPIENKVVKTLVTSGEELSVAESVDKEKCSLNSRTVPVKDSVLMDNSSFMESYSPVYKEKNPIERQATQEIKVISEHSSFFKSQPLESQIAQQIKQFHKLDYQTTHNIPTVLPEPLQDHLTHSIYTLDSQIQQFARNTLSVIDRTILAHISSLESSNYPYHMMTGIETQYETLLSANFHAAMKQNILLPNIQPQICPVYPQGFYSLGAEQSRHLNRLYSVACAPSQLNLKNYDARLNFNKQDTNL